tara:strand:- start:4784 stop:4993 length:210 start_codon:yes stop_codon:yes gene_type:complete
MKKHNLLLKKNLVINDLHHLPQINYLKPCSLFHSFQKKLKGNIQKYMAVPQMRELVNMKKNLHPENHKT